MRELGRLSVALALVALATVIGLAGLAQLKFNSVLSDSVGQRLEIVATTAAQDLESAVDLGLAVDEIANASSILERAWGHDPAISGIAVFDLGGTVLHAIGDGPTDHVHPRTHEAFRVATLEGDTEEWSVEVDDRIRSGVVVLGSFGRPVAGVVVHYPTTETRAQEAAMGGALLSDALWIGALVALAIGLAYTWVRRSRSGSSLSRFVALALGLTVVALAAFGLLIVQDFNEALEPELERRSDLIGTTVRDDVERALEVGVPLASLVGMGPYVEALIEDFPELDYVIVRDVDGAVLHVGGTVVDAALESGSGADDPDGREVAGSLVYRFGLEQRDRQVGVAEIGIDAGFTHSKLEDLALDLAVIIAVALVLAYEVTLTVSERVLGRGRVGAAGLLDVRFVVFVFVLAEELNKSFLPQFTLAATDADGLLDPAVAVSLPIVAYLLTLGLASPIAGRLGTTLEHRRLLLVGLALASVSHLGMVFAAEVWQITLLRGLTGVGFAFTTIACLEYLLEQRPEAGRTRVMGTFVAVVIGGTFAGTALGGILAASLGYRPVFLVSLVLVGATALLAWRVLSPSQARTDADGSQAFTIREVLTVLRQPRLLALLAGVTVPMNALLAAFLWYLIPLALAAEGASAAVIGRTMMLYYLAVLLAGPLLERITSRVPAPMAIASGAVVSGAVLLVPAVALTTLSASLTVVVVGLGHAAIRGPQLVLAVEIGEEDASGPGRGATLAAMRSLERFGALAGLLAAALVASASGLGASIAMVGVAVGLAGAAYLGSVVVNERRVQHA